MSLTSVWEGSRVYEPTGALMWSGSPDAGLRRLLNSGSPLVIVGRNSSTSSSAGARAAAVDCYETAREVLSESGLDVMACLPSVDELVGFLKESPNVLRSVTPDGDSFTNRFVLVDMRSVGLVLSLSNGSARKLDASFDQPHVEWLQMLFSDSELRPRGLVAKRFDRLSRDEWAIGPLRQHLSALHKREPLWVKEGTHRVWRFDDSENVSLLMNGQRGRQDAEELQEKRFRGYETWTDLRMMDGRVRFGAAAPMPPGLFRYKDNEVHRTVMAVDEERGYPREAASALPNVRDADGRVVYQAENVCWALSQFGGDLSVAQVMAELMRRRYSTDTLRKRVGMGPSAFYGGPTRPGSDWLPARQVAMARTIFQNLDMYKTGRFVVKMGRDRMPLVVENIFPERGYWATPEDFARIECWLEPHRVTRQRANWSWSGMPVSVNGVDTVLRHTGATEYVDEVEVRWSLIPDAGERDVLSAAVPGKVPVIDDSWLTAAVLGGVLAANGQPLRRFVEGSDTDRQTRLLEERSSLEVEVARLDRTMVALRGQLSERDADTGERLVSGMLLRDLNDEYEALGATLDQVRDRAVIVDGALVDFKPQQRGVPVKDLQQVMNGMSNPKTNEYRDALREAVHDLRLESVEVCSPAGFRGIENKLSGTLVIDSGGEAWGVGFSDSFLAGPAKDEALRVADAERSMRAGLVTYGINTNTDEYRAYRAFLARIGRNISAFTYANCHDSDLLRLGMAVTCPPPPDSGLPTMEALAADPDIAAKFGHVAALLNRIKNVYGESAKKSWLITRQQTAVVEHLVKVATGRLHDLDSDEARRSRAQVCTWERGSDRWHRPLGPSNAATMRPCVWCGSLRCGPMRFREATGYVCLEPDCRKDEAGVRWDQTYDRYLHAPHLWLAAGIPLDVPDEFDGSLTALNKLKGARRNQRERLWQRNLRIDDLTNDEQAIIAEEYQSTSITSTALAYKWRLLHDTLLQVVDAQGVPRRSSVGKHRYKQS